jgi:hypothetical protein
MTTKGNKKSTQKVKDLKVKSVSADKAKYVKGGPQSPPWIKSGPTTQS